MHSIRLRGPWQLEPVCRYVSREDGFFDASTVNLPAAATMKMPADWSAAYGGGFLGRVRYVRTFHAPSGLVPEERVWLVVEPQRSAARVMMGGDMLGVVATDAPAQRFDITHRLEPFNRLEIVVDHPALENGELASSADVLSQPGGLIGEVRLEIEE